MTLRRLLMLGFLTLLFGVSELSAAQPGFVPHLPKVSADAKTVAKDNNQFALDLYAQLGKEDGNLFYSPYSISTALGMTYAGAKGKTADEMAATLHFNLPPEKLHAALGELVKYLNAKGDKRPYQLSVANALWGQKGYTFQPDFLNLTDSKYGAGLKDVDFVSNSEEARKIINAWVEQQTNDKIKELLKPGMLDVDTRLVLTNAIYFKASWANAFQAAATKPGDFTLANGEKVQAQLMQKYEVMPYFAGKDFTAVSIPYQGHGLSMIVLLPKDAKGLAAVEKSLTAAQVNDLLKNMKAHQVNLKLPKFKVTSEFSLNKALTSMGMPTAFIDGKADFSGMTTQNKLHISAVIHKAFVDVHENGTEAAAATAVIMTKEASGPVFPQATFHADHGFTYLIYENQTGSILFTGRLANPNQ